jgi:hypothetical protein
VAEGFEVDAARLAVAALAGFACGAAVLCQLFLRDALGNSPPGATKLLRSLLLGALLLAAVVSLGLLLVLLPRSAPHNGGSEFEFYLVIVCIAATVLLGRPGAKVLAKKARARASRA